MRMLIPMMRGEEGCQWQGGGVGKALAGAVLGGAADMRGVRPDDLREVAPVLEVGHAGRTLAVETVVPADFAVVEQVGDDGSDIVSLYTCGDILAIATTIRIPNSSQ